MPSKKKDVLILIALIILLIAINYNYFDDKLKDYLSTSETAIVQRVIDGDTIVVNNNTHIRMLGINTPEKGEIYNEEAKKFLEDLVLNKTITLEYGKERYDRYKRILAYVYIDENINIKLVENGLANFYFPSGRDVHYEDFKKSWENCLVKNINLCEKSTDKCYECIELKKLDYKNQEVIFYNRCNFDCNLKEWEIKDEGRKNFIFENFVLKKNKEVLIKVGEEKNTEDTLYWKNEEYVWTETGDTLFLRDNLEKLVLWKNY